ncbi:MAG TPA: flavin reductase family protein [Acidimicrobiales bacterium]|nr:flavin reductase family protein [Acidimicrobiales bacterium]
MPVQSDEPVGPFPPGADPSDYDKLRRRVMWAMPSGLYVIGSRAGERRNGMTANWVTQVSSVPKLVAVAVERDALTHELVHDGGVFSVCIIDREDRAIVRKFTKPVEVDLEAKALNGVTYVEKTTGAPILAQSVAWLDCAVRQEVEVGSHTLFVGEVVDAGFAKDEATPVLRMEDTRMNYGG